MVPEGQKNTFGWKQTAPRREGQPQPIEGKLEARRYQKGKIHLLVFAQSPLGERQLGAECLFSLLHLSLESLHTDTEEVTVKTRPTQASRRENCSLGMQETLTRFSGSVGRGGLP